LLPAVCFYRFGDERKHDDNMVYGQAVEGESLLRGKAWLERKNCPAGANATGRTAKEIA